MHVEWGFIPHPDLSGETILELESNMIGDRLHIANSKEGPIGAKHLAFLDNCAMPCLLRNPFPTS